MPEISVVMPCRNEEETLPSCIAKAKDGIANCGTTFEIIIVNNGSTDRSAEIASKLGCKVISQPIPGYGSALRAGISASSGDFIIMGDCDDSYDFRDIPRFLSKLRKGHDLVLGCRLPCGGGELKKGSMPLMHKWIGNPFLTKLTKLLYAVPFNDVNCGLRGIRRDFINKLEFKRTQMEFAVEMVIEAKKAGGRLAEIPIAYSVDGRKSRNPHLRTYVDGWKILGVILGEKWR